MTDRFPWYANPRTKTQLNYHGDDPYASALVHRGRGGDEPEHMDAPDYSLMARREQHVKLRLKSELLILACFLLSSLVAPVHLLTIPSSPPTTASPPQLCITCCWGSEAGQGKSYDVRESKGCFPSWSRRGSVCITHVLLHTHIWLSCCP